MIAPWTAIPTPAPGVSETFLARGGPPDHEAGGKDHEEIRHVLAVALRAGDALHAEPEIVVGADEEDADEDGLDDPEPRHEAAHHGDAHGLVIGVDLAPQV